MRSESLRLLGIPPRNSAAEAATDLRERQAQQHRAAMRRRQRQVDAIE